jgi:hypothetical protein
MSKRVVAIGDLHSGHRVGLTPPKFNAKAIDSMALAMMREKLWVAFAGWIDSLRPIDLLIVNADCIEGKGDKSGGTELLFSDRNKQCEVAVEVINFCKARNVVMSYGTAYHTGKGEDWEDIIARDVGAREITSHGQVDVLGTIFDYKHHISGSTIPHGRHTAAAREHLWNLLWNEHGEVAKAHVILRSHVHGYYYCGGSDWLAMTLPGLQGLGSKFGARIPSGTVDFGIVSFDVTGKGEYAWQPHLLEAAVQRKAPLAPFRK